MARNLSLLGPVLAAALAASALVASAASAQGKLTSDGPVTLEMTEASAGANALTTLGEVECSGFVYTGHKLNATPHLLIPIGATAFTMTPHYNPNICTGPPMTAKMNGCDYVFNIGSTVTEKRYALSADIVCPPGKHIQFEQFSSAAHTLRLCTITIKPQNGLAGPDITTNTATDDLHIVGTFKKIDVEKSGLCGSSTNSEGTWDIDVTVKGTSSIGATTGITVTD